MAGAVGDEAGPPPIDQDELLWRLLRPEWIVVDQGIARVSSAAFKDRTEPETCAVSVFRLRLMDAEFRRTKAQRFEKAAEVAASVPVSMGHRVEPDLSEGQHPSHAVIIPPHRGNNPWDRDARALAKRCQIVLVVPQAA
jgi:hypothetical protein